MKLNDSEWTVMTALWDAAPANARELLTHVHDETEWSYSTLKTVLARLVEKGAVRESKRGNTSVFEPRVSRETARRAAVRSLLDKAFDGTFGALVQHMVSSEKLNKRERERLARLLSEADRERRDA